MLDKPLVERESRDRQKVSISRADDIGADDDQFKENNGASLRGRKSTRNAHGPSGALKGTTDKSLKGGGMVSTSQLYTTKGNVEWL